MVSVVVDEQRSVPGRRSPRVSIVIPAYDRERYVDITMRSVFDQSMDDWELVVVDDGSHDATADVARTCAADDARVTVLSGPNGGVARARSRGLAATDPTSEFVIFLDSDDVWEPSALALLMGELEAHPEFGSVYGLARCIDDDGAPIAGDDLEERMRERLELRNGRVTPIGPDEPTTFAGLVHHNWVVTPGLHLIRRTVLTRAGDFDPSTDPADDWDIALRISRVADIGFVDQCVLNWRRHPDTLTTTSPRWRQAYFQVRNKTIADPVNTPDQQHVARLAYRNMASGLWGDARRQFADRQFSAGARQAAKAASGQARYLRAVLSPKLLRTAHRSR
jgi:GT2 family glycosyltransferase